jgi:DNA-binding transcriptional LysR family regulator
MKLNNERLRAFYQAAIDRNFHRAADSLCITQSALSQRVMKLEQDIEATLFIRGNEGISLTSAGSVLFDYVRNLENLEQETLNRIAGHNDENGRGNLRIATYSSILRSAIMPALAKLITESKDLHVEFFSRELRDLPAMLKSGEVDFIILDHLIEKDKISSSFLGDEHLVHVRHHNHSAEDQVFLDHDVEDLTTFQFFRFQNHEPGQLRRRFYNDIYGIIDGVKLGAGQAIVSHHLITNEPDIIVVPYGKTMTHPVYLYFHENRYLTEFHKKVIETLKENTNTYLTPAI